MMDLFNEITEFKASLAIRKKLVEYSVVKTFKEGDDILREGSYIHGIPIIATGSVRVMRTNDDGREILLYYIKTGESCVMSILGGLHNDTSKVKAVAEEDTEIFFIPNDKLASLIKEYPQFLDYIFRLYHKRFEESLDIINEIAFKKMDERLLALLEKKTELYHDQTINITHEQLANELGTARVVISRLLKQLEEYGAVSLGRNKLTVLKSLKGFTPGND
ncbi:Crp/Fnr family transcriptional regulator [uncultured Bacteroides sp.]|uniref:Crp/Fnr family transcriptional regulator n=1 Tax=uncultured Bacteroides sp. TaxID=162156 RepID=UPI002AAA7432|nr:Crp/Fnr family transcriptional regulator [uncultured Bacteroides sp.]